MNRSWGFEGLAARLYGPGSGPTTRRHRTFMASRQYQSVAVAFVQNPSNGQFSTLPRREAMFTIRWLEGPMNVDGVGSLFSGRDHGREVALD
ncbi:MAG TPA: hypothetical protein PKD54_04375 [Pirellulaceae bacterium]|nr:hypothetical protein [Pirellulaceae bacterium]